MARKELLMSGCINTDRYFRNLIYIKGVVLALSIVYVYVPTGNSTCRGRLRRAGTLAVSTSVTGSSP